MPTTTTSKEQHRHVVLVVARTAATMVTTMPMKWQMKSMVRSQIYQPSDAASSHYYHSQSTHVVDFCVVCAVVSRTSSDDDGSLFSAFVMVDDVSNFKSWIFVRADALPGRR
jgi:hypothetical protein